jgi:hypothetical protein
VLLTSRSFQEYQAFFDLTPDDVAGRVVLDCCAGASGFVAGVRSRGGHPIAVDLAVCSHLLFTWSEQSGLPGSRFTAPVPGASHRSRGRAANTRPTSSSASRGIPPTPCSQRLRLKRQAFDAAWHDRALRELLRVASEVRVFPLVVQRTGHPVEFLPDLLDDLRKDGVRAEVRGVPFEFQRGAREMLVLRRPVGRSGIPAS